MTSHVYIIGEIGTFGVSLQNVKDQIDSSANDISVHIYSPGGEVYEGFAIYNFLRNQGKPVNVYIEGLCASIASVIAMAGDTITINPMSQFMIHNPWSGVVGDAEDMRKEADNLDSIKAQIISAYLTRSTLSEKELWKMLDNETWLTSEQAVEMGFADEVGQTLKAVAYFKKDMNTEKEKSFLDKIDEMVTRFENSVKKAIKPVAQAEEVKDEPVAEIDAIKAENDALKAENEAIKAQLAEQSQKVEAAEAKSTELVAEFEEIKNELAGFKNLMNSKDKPAASAPVTGLASGGNSVWDQMAANARKLSN